VLIAKTLHVVLKVLRTHAIGHKMDDFFGFSQTI
jgi:hypothetical protein